MLVVYIGWLCVSEWPVALRDEHLTAGMRCAACERALSRQNKAGGCVITAKRYFYHCSPFEFIMHVRGIRHKCNKLLTLNNRQLKMVGNSS